jgi:hypothetical protein
MYFPTVGRAVPRSRGYHDLYSVRTTLTYGHPSWWRLVVCVRPTYRPGNSPPHERILMHSASCAVRACCSTENVLARGRNRRHAHIPCRDRGEWGRWSSVITRPDLDLLSWATVEKAGGKGRQPSVNRPFPRLTPPSLACLRSVAGTFTARRMRSLGPSAVTACTLTGRGWLYRTAPAVQRHQ